MRKLVILGNGIDLNFGLHSSFKDYFESNDAPQKLKRLIELDGKENWYNLENFIMRMSSTRLDGNSTIMEHPGVYHETYYRLIPQMYLIQKSLIKYLKHEEEHVEKGCFSKNVRKYLESASSIINFNYTDITTDSYKIPRQKIYHVHGSLKEKYIILGNANESLVEGVPNYYRVFSKPYLRDILDLKRYLCKKYLHKIDIFNRFKTYDAYYYSQYKLSPYLIEPEVYQILCSMSNYYDENSKYFYDKKFDLFKGVRKEDFRRIEQILLKTQQNKDFFTGFIDYLVDNCFRPFKIKLPIKPEENNIPEYYAFPEEFDEITIIGHSLQSDKELIADLIRVCINLKKINIFRFNGEEKQNLNILLKYNDLDENIVVNEIEY
ncbi:hypothetical protein DM476_07630 [Lactobacillus helveticus]|uniref:AbiH family protein n=1 Tax=Lactobacillus helveticus TaxID=1587 RepID=UPI000D7D04C8|nr:AbiH family protein [Lactobacillus helveticus]PXZ16126.1 hypothetical protein DM476_07630 [Lactobacillus helveticus]